MNTKLAIEFLTQSHNDLTSFLTGLGLLNNEAGINDLKTTFDAAFQVFLDDYDNLKAKVTVTSSQIETIEESLTLADDYYRVEEERLQNLLAQKASLVKEIEIFEEQKESIEKFSDEEKLVIQAKVDEIKQEIFETEEEIAKRRQEISDKQVLINTYSSQIHDLRQQEAHHNSLAAKYDQESKVWSVVGTGRSGKKKYGWTTDPNKIALRDQEYAKAAALDKQADDLAVNISVLQKEIKDTKQFIPILEQELIAHILRLDTQKDLLSLSGLDTAQKLESVKLQIQQQTEDLETLNNQEIIEQETIVNNANQKLSDLQSELEELQATATLAETELTDFETINAYLLAEDVTEFLDWNIDEDTPEVVKLWQQYLAVEGEEIISERLTSLQSQAASEEAVKVALEADSIEGYVILSAELAEEIESLSAIWLENLQESHQLTVDVWNLSEKRTQAVNELETYIEDNLADPEGEYLLDKIQLQEAISRQEAQVNYADALGESVDSLEEAIAVLTTQQQQVNLLSEKIDHISKLTTYEQGYAALQDILNRLDSVNETDYQWSNEQVIKVTEELIDFLSNNKQSPEIIDKLNEILNNYKSFYQANSEIYSNKYQAYININTQKNIDLDIVSDNKKEVQQKALSKGAKFSNVTGNYYFIGHSVNNWYAARNEGTAAGGHLVAINSWEEQRWLNQNFGYLTYWIGLTDEVREGHWRWVNGEPITFTNWIPGEPNNKRGENYAYSYGDGKWNDVDPITDWGGTKRGLIEINYSLFDQQIKEINDQAIADQAIVADEIDALHDHGIKLLINQTAEILRPLLINKLDDEINNKTQDLVSEIDLEISSINYLTSQITVEYEGKKYYGELTYDNSALKYQAEEWLSEDNIKEFSFNFLGKTYTRNDFYWSEKGISLGFFDGDPVAALFAFNTPDGHNFGFGQESNSNINWSNGFLQWDFNNSKWIENVGTLDFSDPANTEILEQQEQWLETNLQNYIEQKQNNFTQDITNQEQTINNLQNLRVETAYLTLQAEQNPDKLQDYLEESQVIFNGNLSILPDVKFNFINHAQGLKTGYWADENNSEQLTGDFDGDGLDDIVNLQSDGISNNWVALSNGNGTFNLKGAYSLTNSNNSHQTGLIAGFWGDENNSEQLIGDFNGDGLDDIINLQSDGISNNWVALSNGNGTFILNGAAANGSNSHETGLIAGFWGDENNSEQLIGDFDGDGLDDIVNLQSDGGSNNWIALSNGDGTFSLKGAAANSSNSHETGLIAGFWGDENNSEQLIGDFNGDGLDDIVNLQSDGVSNNWIALSNGDRTFHLKGAAANGSNSHETGLIAGYWGDENHSEQLIGDFNGDGLDDIVNLQSDGGSNNWIALSNGDGTFSLKGAAANGYNSHETGLIAGFWGDENHSEQLIGDFNGDGLDDIVNLQSDGSSNNWIALSNGDGTFKLLNHSQGLTAGYWGNENNSEQLIGDFDGDGLDDIVNLQSDGTSNNWVALTKNRKDEAANLLRNQYYPALSDATTLYNLQQQITYELTNSQQELETLKAQIAQKQANATAALSQADWYEEQAAIHWDLSRKAGPTWIEWRSYKKRGLFGSKRKWIAITHVDHHWIIWDAYTKQATNLRKYSANLDQEVIEDSQQQNLTDQLITQWQQANEAADEAELTLDQFIAQLELLEAQRQLLPEQEAQLETFSDLFPTLKEQLAIAQLAADEAKTNTGIQQVEYDNSSQAYQTALNDVLEKKATLDTNTQNLLQQIANTRAWVEQQTLSLDTELTETVALQLELQTQLDEIATQPLTPETETKTIQLQQSIDLLNQKQIILTAQQTALTQKITLLEAQKTVVETEHQLLLFTIDSPDSDYSNLEEQLLDAQNALSEVQELAQQAEATSIALTASMEDLQAFLEVQNDQYLNEIQSKQSTLQQLLDTTELKENYTLLATEKQLELNTLETQLQTRLIEATEAGSQEAAYLLTVAQQNNFATAAEIYYRDYRDLMTDTGGGCAGGIARPDDAVKADYYYNEMLKYRALQEQAQQQADQFAIVKEAAEDQIDLIQQQQAIAQTEFNDIQSSINNTQEDIESLQQQLNIAELRIDALEYLRNWTEQTLVQLLQVEQFNLAQATLEQEFATQRQLGIDETITAKFEKQQADITRDRAIATAKLEQLNQLQAEDALQQALNDLRTDLGLQPIEDIIQQAEYKGQLAGILSELETIQNQPELPENIQTILAETTADIHDALQGKEAQTIQENLLNSANALISEANELQTEIAKLDAEEERLLGILEDSQTDLQGATKALYDEIIISQELGEETDGINQEYLEVLYKIGYAESAVDLSSELAKQSKDILEQIIEGRIEERKARKKAFVNELLGTVTLVISVVAAVYTAGAALSAFAGAIGQGATFAAATSIAATAASTAATGTFINTLTTIGASLSAVQSAYNGDWSGAIFNAGMAALGAANIANPKAELGLGGIQSFKDAQQVASGLYYGYQATESGDNLSALLNVFSAALPIGNLTEYNYFSQAAFSINSGVELAEEDEWLAATSNFLNAAFTLADNLSETFGDDLAVSTEVLDILSRVELAVNIGDGVQTISDDGSLEGWLRGVQGIAGGVTNYFQEQKEIEQKEKEQEKENDDNTDTNEDNQNDTETENDDNSSNDTGNENQDSADTVDDTSSGDTGNENQDNIDNTDIETGEDKAVLRVDLSDSNLTDFELISLKDEDIRKQNALREIEQDLGLSENSLKDFTISKVFEQDFALLTVEGNNGNVYSFVTNGQFFTPIDTSGYVTFPVTDQDVTNTNTNHPAKQEDINQLKGLWIGAKDAAIEAGEGIYNIGEGFIYLTAGWFFDREKSQETLDGLKATGEAIYDDPGLIWDAIKDPYVTRWEEGRYGEAIGRGSFEAIAAVFGTKGLDKVTKSAKVGDKLVDLGPPIEIKGSNIKKYTPLDESPLLDILGETKGKEVISSFRGGTYTAINLNEELTVYRSISVNSVSKTNPSPTGGYWTLTKPVSSIQAKIDSALDPSFNNHATYVIKAKIPKNTNVYYGVAESQLKGFGNNSGNFVGGGHQLYIPEIKNEWLTGAKDLHTGNPSLINNDFSFELLKKLLRVQTQTTKSIDPLVIDLEGNGVHLINLENSSIFFDFDADGYAENTAWVSPEDGILTLDLNQDGTINNITEVFSEFFNDGSPNSGLDALATLDSNQNGIISATDTQFNQILVWQDINQDGISQPDELKTLTDHGITSINLNGITTETIQDGNIIKKRSIFNRNDGTSGEISDIAFLVTQTGFKVNQTDTGIEILAEDDTAVSLFIHEDETGLTLNLADTNLQVAIGNTGNDYLYTTANNDIFLSGEAGNDTLVGSDGNDWLVGDEGSDRLEGFAGDDLLYIDAQDSFIDGGDGTDIAIVTTVDAVTLDLGTSNLEMVIGNDGDDTLTHSGNYTVVMDGGKGNDNLTGGSNDDVLTGGDGDDYIQGSDGSDRLEGSQGNDNLHGWVGSDEIYGGLDNDTLYGQQDNDSLYGDEGDDQLHGNEGDDSLEGGSGSDTLYGHQGNDTLLGNIGDDQLYGDAGDDSLQGGEGNDQLFGNIGHDTLFGNQGDDLLYGEDGNDTISGNDGNDQLHGWNGADILNGGNGEDTLYGHFDDDTLTGGENSDRLFGDQGNDLLDGGSGDDLIEGGEGNDTIIGGLGVDTLTGGNDADIFPYKSFDESPTANPDTITDFEQGSDRIDLSKLLLDSFNDLNINQANGVTTISANNQDFVINLNNEMTLTSEDFIFNTAITTS